MFLLINLELCVAHYIWNIQSKIRFLNITLIVLNRRKIIIENPYSLHGKALIIAENIFPK